MIAALQRIALQIWCATPSHWIQAAAKFQVAQEKAAEVLDTPTTAAIDTQRVTIVASAEIAGNSSHPACVPFGPAEGPDVGAELKEVHHGL